MNNKISIILIGFLIICGNGTLITTHSEVILDKTETFSILISNFNLKENGNYLKINFKEATSSIIDAGKPIIPVYTKIFTLPLGSKIKEINVKFSNSNEIYINKQIQPAPKYYPEIPNIELEYDPIKDLSIYHSKELYPSDNFTYSFGAGIDGNNRVMFLSIRCYPVKYSPYINKIIFHKNINISIIYENPSNSFRFIDEYDLVIIAPDEFSDSLKPLINHKNNLDNPIKTIFKSTEEIYIEYSGIDKPEKIKYFIKDAIENWGISYVLLVGGMKGQQFEWYLPVRYTKNFAGYPLETGFISDLYYADIYKTIDNELVFEDWDSNGNGIFAEFVSEYNETLEKWEILEKDIIDCRPDVHLGRLACRSISEVNILVNKIINYESTPAESSWFNRLLLVAGDTYPPPNAAEPDAYEAEIDTNLTASYMDGFNAIRLWASLGTLTGQEDVEREFNKGNGFIHMAGHANPSILVTNSPKGENGKITILRIYNLLIPNAIYTLLYQGGGIKGAISRLKEPRNPSINNNKLPIIVIGGCHNSQFNVSIYNILKYGFPYAYGHGIYCPKCFSWYLTSIEDGGAIATMGNTGLGMGLPGYNYTEGLDGWLFPRFFYNYGVKDFKILGESFSGAITDYVNEFDINEIDIIHLEDGPGAVRQMVEQWELLGDPSLRIGGYY